MSEKVNWLPAERVDLLDMKYGAGGQVEASRAQLMREALGAGVLEGFRVEVLPQSGADVGSVEVVNGRAISWRGEFLNMETGTERERLNLRSPLTEYFVEAEILWVKATLDARVFWDSLVNNTDPIPDGREVPVNRVFTREIPTWRVVQPVRSNPVGKRSDGGYTPAHFSPSGVASVIPLCVLRTDGSGKIVSGDANADIFGNDLGSVSTSGGTKSYVKAAGYDESLVWANPPTNTIPLAYGRKTSDQRPRMFEMVMPPFLYGASGETVGGSWSDEWARDVKSAFDHLAGQISQVKHGAHWGGDGTSSMGHYQDGTVREIEPSGEWADLSQVFTNSSPPALMVATPDQFIGCSFWVMEGPWRGFYAKVTGNDRTDGMGVTRLYLSLQSQTPTRKDVPPGDVACVILQSRQKNWMAPPCPSSGQRGLNALDDEVVSGRVDWWSGQTFKATASRLNANKAVMLTLAPPDPLGANTVTGEPNTNLWPRADVFATIADIRTAVANLVTLNRSGVVVFRSGVYDFDSVPAGTPAFQLVGCQGWVLQGSGIGNTILDLDDHAGTIFALAACSDITFKDMTIQSKGNPLAMYGCSRIRFDNVRVVGEFDVLTTPTLDIGSGVGLMMEDCIVELSGAGLTGTGLSDARIRNCLFIGGVNATELDALWNISGPMVNSHAYDNYFYGFGASYLVKINGLTGSVFENNRVKGNTSFGGSKISLGAISESVISGIRGPRVSPDNATNFLMRATSLTNSNITDVWGEGVKDGLWVSGSVTNSVLDGIEVDSYGGGTGLRLANLTKCLVDKFVFTSDGNGNGIRVDGFSDRLLLRDCVISGDSLWAGIYFTSQSKFEMVGIVGCDVMKAARGLSILNASGVESVLIQGNKVTQTTDAAYAIKFSGSPYGVIFDQNQCGSSTGLGLSLELTGAVGKYWSTRGNKLVATKRAFEIWTTGSGSLESWGLVDNDFMSETYCPVAIGVGASGAVPAAPGSLFGLYRSHLAENRLQCSIGSATGAMWLTKMLWCKVDDNVMEGNDLWGIMCVGEVKRSSISGNIVVGGSDRAVVDKMGAIYIPKVSGLIESSLMGNQLYIFGDNYHGVFLGADCEDNELAFNQVRGGGSGNQVGLWAPGLVGSIVAGWRIRATKRGAWFDYAHDNMITGNIMRGMTGGSPKYFVFSTNAFNNRGGYLDPKWFGNIAVVPGESSLNPGGAPLNQRILDFGDEAYQTTSPGVLVGNYLSPYNYGF